MGRRRRVEFVEENVLARVGANRQTVETGGCGIGKAIGGRVGHHRAYQRGAVEVQHVGRQERHQGRIEGVGESGGLRDGDRTLRGEVRRQAKIQHARRQNLFRAQVFEVGDDGQFVRHRPCYNQRWVAAVQRGRGQQVVWPAPDDEQPVSQVRGEQVCVFRGGIGRRHAGQVEAAERGHAAAVGIVANARRRADPGKIHQRRAQRIGQVFHRDRAVRAAAIVIRHPRLAGGGKQVAIVGKAIAIHHHPAVRPGEGGRQQAGKREQDDGKTLFGHRDTPVFGGWKESRQNRREARAYQKFKPRRSPAWNRRAIAPWAFMLKTAKLNIYTPYLPQQWREGQKPPARQGLGRGQSLTDVTQRTCRAAFRPLRCGLDTLRRCGFGGLKATLQQPATGAA